ncbi:EAL domain-containing protein [Breoghania sp. L-A4]|uniref:putative bifunctional diguanylate cyclase/phosphodiesterase n=1 Tax=Breoghania sp. L-A4 TaxID=2304600 RepID=UPI000E3604C4|nr:EAL domain-containing protein [Breoghania sp. L-A4]AXS40954.1 EAL domain-containing protein [Breoghania sp. L-A4]
MVDLFKNSSIRLKTLVASFVLLICMLLPGISAYLTFSKTDTGLKSLSTVTLPKQLAVSKLKDDIVDTHVSIFRYVSWASNGVSPILLDALRAEVFAGVNSTTQRFSEFADRPDLSDIGREKIHALQTEWKRYEDVAKDTLDVGGVDAPMATMMLGMVDDEFKNVDRDLKAFLFDVTEKTRSFAEDLAYEASANKRVLAIGGMIAMAVSLVTALMVARSIVHPIQSITNLMQQVSSGKLDVEISDPQRRDEIGRMVRAVAAFREKIEHDNQLLKNREEELRLKNMQFDAALRNMSQGLVMFDSNARLVLFNQQYSDMYELSSDRIEIGWSFNKLLAYRRTLTNDYGNYNESTDTIPSAMRRGETTHHVITTSDGRIMNVINRPLPEGGWVATHEDITERHRAEKKIASLARQDTLTGLSNRASFLEAIEKALTQLNREKASFAIFVLDLDQFKAVNDSMGHPVGDALLKEFGDRLRAMVGKGDTVARLGGDEFAVLQATAAGDQKQAALALAEDLLDITTAPYMIEGAELVIGASIGIALAPEDGIDADQLLKSADLALYKTKSDGRNGYRFFDRVMAEETRSRRTLALDMRKALARDEFELHYQTIVDTATMETCGVEALARWQHPRRGMIPPDMFIAIAEETGLIIPLGERLLRKACRDASRWPAHIKIAVNLSPVQFRAGNLTQTVVTALADSGLAPERLEIEITESVLLQQNSENLAFLHDLRELGVSVVLDDFGTGYSSLSYLQVFPFDKIKIDRSFVNEMQKRSDCAAIVGAIIGLGRSLDITTTAEGIETREQFDMLRAAGCHQVQGYLFSRPVALSKLDLGATGNKTAGELRRGAG